MNTSTKVFLFAFAFAGASQAATLTLVENTNPEEVTGGGTDFVSQILVGQTLYVGIPYAGTPWPTAEATDYFEVATYLLGVEDSGTASFSFYSAADSGSDLSGITELSGFTGGMVNVAQQVSTNPLDTGNLALAGVTARIEYPNLTGNPFNSLTEGMLWLGITNTGSSTLSYYTGTPFGFGSPAPGYAFAAPFDSGATSLYADTYTYNSGGDLATANENVHPYLAITAQTVPEPGVAALGLLGGVLLLRRRRIG
jgi:uncharacterized protein (TIGR03382 family)